MSKRTRRDLTSIDGPSQIRVVDLFSGCGGLSRGLERTGLFTSIFGVDINKVALETFARNHGTESARPAVYLGDIRKLRIEDVWDALRLRRVNGPGELECLVGGPPCEGFSRNTVYTHRDDDDAVGVRSTAPVKYREAKYWQSAWQATVKRPRSRAKRVVRAYNPSLHDPRNFLFRAFLDVAAMVRPKVILIENVRQMLSHAGGTISQEIIATLQQLGYRTEAKVLNAAAYGVPQLRQRAFFLAVRTDVISSSAHLPWPVPTHADSDSDQAQLFRSPAVFSGDCGAFLTTREAIGDLPPGHPEKVGNPRQPASAYPDVPLSAFRRFVRSTTQTPANHVYRTPSEQVIERLRSMKPGMRPHELPAELQTRKYYYNAYGRLEWDKPANTITKSFLYPGSGRFGHPSEDRVISYREAARLQSFDDDFTFFATSQEGIAHMIGGAVPPLVGYCFGQTIAELLRSQSQIKRVS